MTDNPTVFQRLVEDEEQAEEMIADLEDLENLVPEDEDPDDVEGWQMSLTFSHDDVPHIIEELEGIVDEP